MAKKKQAEQHALLADVPISTPKHDALGRSPFAKSLARTIRSMKGDDSFVFALCGRWGSGKSSVLRMVVHELEKGRSATKPEIVSFNPWWFSGQDQLLQGFLSQLSAVLGRNDTGKRTTKLGERIGTLGKVLRPFGWIPGTGNIVKDVAEILEKAGEATTGLGQQLTADVQQVRAEIDDLLRSRNRRIVVVMDDIDRLTASEITQLFLIVKAVADFPNTVYLLAFDPEVVCKAIGEKLGLDGASYLEKIVQVQVDLPSAGPIPLHQMFFSQLGLLLDEKVTTRTAQYDFADLFHDGVKEFLQTPRAVKRIINVLRALYPAVEGEVYWPDFVAVIALMVFVPTVFRLVRDNPERFAGQEHWETRERDQESAFHQEWRDQIAKNFKEPVAEIMCRLFPKVQATLGHYRIGDNWESRARSDLRVSSPAIFPRYFQLSIPAGAMSEAEWSKIVGLLPESAAIDTYIGRICQEKGEHGLSTRAKEFLERASLFAKYRATQEEAKLLFKAVLRNGDTLVEARDAEMMLSVMAIENSLRIWWVLSAALLKVKDQPQRESFLEECLAGEIGLYAAAEFVDRLGSRYGKFGSTRQPQDSMEVDEACVDRAIAIMVSRIQQAASDGALVQHPRSLAIAHDWREFSTSDDAKNWVSAMASGDRVFVGFVEQVRSVCYTEAMGNRVARAHVSVSARTLATWFDGIAMWERCEQLLKSPPEWLTKEQRTSLRALRDLIQEDGTVVEEHERKRQRLLAGKLEDDEDIQNGVHE